MPKVSLVKKKREMQRQFSWLKVRVGVAYNLKTCQQHMSGFACIPQYAVIRPLKLERSSSRNLAGIGKATRLG